MQRRQVPRCYSMKEASDILAITVQTFLSWEDKGLAPKRQLIGSGRMKKVLAEDLLDWIDRRDRDRLRLKKPWLRRPVGPIGEVGTDRRNRSGNVSAVGEDPDGESAVERQLVKARASTQFRSHPIVGGGGA